MNVGIFGAGLSGLSLAYFLQNNKEIDNIEILEKEQESGGLCRSFNFQGTYYDIGPHIIFSKDKEVLELMVTLLGSNINKLKRSNKIFYKDRFVKYPFENELSALPEKEKDYCLSSFLNNPYEDYEHNNMLHFFLKTFGEGITNTYLRPYNEKIWKFDPAFMDTQMVERIPKPPKEDIIKSAEGVETEGYLHQLHFYYPQKGGIASLVKAFADRFDNKVKIIRNFNIINTKRLNGRWHVRNDEGLEKTYDLIISTIPIHALTRALADIVPDTVRQAVDDLKYNSIVICVLKLNKDHIGDNFAVMVPDKEIVFHRLSKINYLMHGAKGDPTTLLVEITYKRGDLTDKMSNDDIKSRVLNDLEKLGFIDTKADCSFIEAKRFEYAYVIYDLHHRKNMTCIKDFFEKELKIPLSGRFGEFEYLNMDAVIRHSIDKSESIKKDL